MRSVSNNNLKAWRKYGIIKHKKFSRDAGRCKDRQSVIKDQRLKEKCFGPNWY